MALIQWGPGLGGAWRRERSRQATTAETITLECVRLAVWIVPLGSVCTIVGS